MVQTEVSFFCFYEILDKLINIINLSLLTDLLKCMLIFLQFIFWDQTLDLVIGKPSLKLLPLLSLIGLLLGLPLLQLLLLLDLLSFLQLEPLLLRSLLHYLLIHLTNLLVILLLLSLSLPNQVCQIVRGFLSVLIGIIGYINDLGHLLSLLREVSCQLLVDLFKHQSLSPEGVDLFSERPVIGHGGVVSLVGLV